MFRRLGYCILFLLVAGLTFGYPFSHHLKWSYYETEHFRLYFTKDTAAVADQAFDMVEPIFSDVTRTLGYAPPDKVELVFANQDDQVNGYAEYFTQTIVIEVSPIPVSMLGPFRKKPLHNLITHELTHIVHLGMNYSSPLVYKLTHRLTSKGFLYPQFMVEGQAVYDEKYLSQGGRLEGTAFEEQMMAFAQAKSYPNLAQITNRRMLRWPQGAGAYIIGAKFVDYLVNQYGRSKLMEVYHEFSGESYLGSFGSAFEAVIHEPLSKVYPAFQDYINLRYLNHVKIDKTAETLKSGPLLRSDLSVQSDGSLSWHENDFHSPARRVKWQMGSPETPEIVVADPYLLGAAVIDTENVYFLRFDQADIYTSRQDLIAKNRRSGAEAVLAEHVNAFDVFNGNVLWVESVDQGESLHLTRVSGIVQQLITADSISSPLWVSAEQVYVVVRNGLKDSLVKLDVRQQTHETVLNVPVRDVAVGPDKNLIFVADIAGLSQAFLFDPESRDLYQLTHAVTGVYSPQWTPSGLVYLTLTDRGRDLVLVNSEKQSVKATELIIPPVSVGPTWNIDETPAVTVNPRVLRTDLFRPVYKKVSHDYEPFSFNLLYFIPYVTFSSYGNYLGFNMMMVDPLQYQQVGLTFMSSLGEESYQLQYLNSWLYPFFSVQAKKLNRVETSTVEFQLPWMWGGRYMQQLKVGIDHSQSVSENNNYYKIGHYFQVGERFLYSVSSEKAFDNQATYYVRQSDQKISWLDQMNVYLPGWGPNHVVHFDGSYGKSEVGVYSLGGVMNSLSVRGYAFDDIKQGPVVGRLGVEYLFPMGVIDDDVGFFGLYGYQTFGTFFAEMGDASAEAVFAQSRYYSYGYLWRMKSIAANMYPVEWGLGLAHTSKAGTTIVFSLGLGI